MLSKINSDFEVVLDQINNILLQNTHNNDITLQNIKHSIQEIIGEIQNEEAKFESVCKFKLAGHIIRMKSIGEQISQLMVEHPSITKIVKKTKHLPFLSPKEMFKYKMCRTKKIVSIKLSKFIELSEELKELQVIVNENDSLNNEFQKFDVSRLCTIYKNEIEHIQAYLKQNELQTTKYLLRLESEFNTLIYDPELQLILQYSEICEQLRNELQQCSEDLTDSVAINDYDSTNFENSRNSFTNTIKSRSKTQTFDITENERVCLLKDISNQVKYSSKDTCINCNIF